MTRRLVALVPLLAACPPPGGPSSTRPAPPAQMYTLADLVGTWRWMHRTTEQGTTRVEDELWRFAPGDTPTALRGRYVRSVEVRSDDRVPFQCNQRPVYAQRAAFDVEVTITPAGFAIQERAYEAEPTPCDHGFRHVSAYEAELDGPRLRLAWATGGAPAGSAGGGAEPVNTGTQTLLQVDDLTPALPANPWPAEPDPVGVWRWDATSYDAEGNVHDEAEWWQVTRRSPTQLDATYRRRVTVRSPDGKPLACANAPSWSFDDAYVLDGQREEEHWHFYERAVDPGDHPCLRLTPHRALDEATAEQLGDYLILEWRGKRRQVLYRPGA